MHHCSAAEPQGPATATTYAVDGGYFENSGILALLEILGQLDVPPIDGRPVEPWILLADNHYRSDAAVAPSGRPLELLVPLITVTGSNVTGQAALEQAAVVATRPGPESCGRFGRLGPQVSPRVAAPLGWALSEESRRSMDQSLRAAIEDVWNGDAADSQCLRPLFVALGLPEPSS